MAMEARRSRLLVGAALVLAVALAMVGSACSSSAPEASRPATTSTSAVAPSPDAVNKGLELVLGPDYGTESTIVPVSFNRCTSAKLSPADRARVAEVTSGHRVPDDLSIRLVRAGHACDAAYVMATLKTDLGGGGGPIAGMTDAEATCAATGTLDALLVADDKAAGTRTDGRPLDDAMSAALNRCYPMSEYVTAVLERSQTPKLSRAQISCIVGKLDPHLNWSSVLDDDAQAMSAEISAADIPCLRE